MTSAEPASKVQEATLMICILQVDGMRFAIDANCVCEVLGDTTPRPVPLAPGYIHGILSYRGDILTALSLRKLLGSKAIASKCCVLVLTDQETDERFGIVVDSVAGLLTLSRSAIEPNPGSLDPQSTFLFNGLYRTDSGLVVRLNPHHLKPLQIANAGLFDPTPIATAGWAQ